MKKTLIYAAIASSILIGGAAQAGTITMYGSDTVDSETKYWSILLTGQGKDVQTNLETYFNEDTTFTLYTDNTYRTTSGTDTDGILTFAGGDEVQYFIGDFSNVLDPVGSFNTSYFDNGTPSTFSSTFGLPPVFFVPTLTGNVNMTGSVSGSITDGTTVRNGVSYIPTAGGKVFTYTLYNTLGTAVGTFGLDGGGTFSGGPSRTYTNPPGGGAFDNGTGQIFNCGSVGCGYVVVTSGLLGSGGNDRYAFTGAWEATRLETPPTPEPSGTAAIVGVGLLGLGLLRRKNP